MSLTAGQLATLKAAILADPTLSALYSVGNLDGLAGALNAVASPAFVVWRMSVSTAEVGRVVNYVAVEAMTDINRGRINTFYYMNPVSFDPSRSDIRSYWANTFSGALGGQGQASRDALEALWRRNALLVEKILATGTGTTNSPATLGYEGTVGYSELIGL